jgi:hypothetical protein
MRAGSTSTGALRIGWRQNLPILRAPVPRPVDPSYAVTPHSNPKRPLCGGHFAAVDGVSVQGRERGAIAVVM